MILGVTGEVRSLQNPRMQVRRAVRSAMALRRVPTPRYVQLQGMSMPVEVQLYGLDGNIFSSISSSFKKALSQIKKYPKSLGKQIKEHEKEIVGVGAAVAGVVITVASGGAAAPLGLAIAGSGIGATMGKSGQWGKPREWGKGALIGGATGYGAGVALPMAWGAQPGWALTGNAGSAFMSAPGWIGGASAAEIAAAKAALAAKVATVASAAPLASATTFSPAGATGAVAPTATAAASGGVPWTGLLTTAGLASQILGGGGGGGGVSAALMPGGTNVYAGEQAYPGYADYSGAYGSSGGGGGGGGGGWGGGGETQEGQANVLPAGLESVLGPVTVDAKKFSQIMPYLAAGLGAAGVVALLVLIASGKKKSLVKALV